MRRLNSFRYTALSGSALRSVFSSVPFVFVLLGLASIGPILRGFGLPWGYRLGIPVATFRTRQRRRVRMVHGSTDEVSVVRRPDCLLISEVLWPKNRARFREAGLVGYLEERDDEVRVSFVANGALSMTAIMLLLPAAAPLLWVVDGGWHPHLGEALALSAVSVVVLGLGFRWARRRARALADHLGFPVSAGAV